jgi:phage baseplate assembly protein gpV
MKEVIKKWWFWVIVGFVFIGFSSCSNKNKELTSYTDQFVIQVGSKNVKVNDLELTLDAPVRELESRSYMPLRFLLDWFGAEDVTYDRATEVITFKLTRYQELDPAIIAKYDAQIKPSKPEQVKTEPVIVIPEITAIALWQAYDENEVKADNTYKGKEFIITGTIHDIGKDITDTPYITFSDGTEYSVTSVQCMFKNKDDVINLNKGDTVKIKGKISGKLLNVLVRNCEFVI